MKEICVIQKTKLSILYSNVRLVVLFYFGLLN